MLKRPALERSHLKATVSFEVLLNFGAFRLLPFRIVNIDNKQNIDNKIQNYVHEIYSSGCFSLINKPTRITSTSATSLDLIYSNSPQKILVKVRLDWTRSNAKRRLATFANLREWSLTSLAEVANPRKWLLIFVTSRFIG